MEVKKYKKYHKKKNILKLEQHILSIPKQGFYGLKSLECGVITPQQLEASRRLISRITKRSGKIIIKVKFDHPLTRKPLLSRMGKGSGSFHSWIAYLKKGKVIIELLGVSKQIAVMAFTAVCKRLPSQFEIIQREVIDA